MVGYDSAKLQLLSSFFAYPINFTRGTRFKHDPAVPMPPLPTLSAANDIRATPKELRGFAETQLTRGQNQVVAAMRAAIKTIARAT